MDISFKTKDNPEARTVTFAMPETLQALVDAYGEETVAAAAKGQFVISLQALARRHIEKSDEEIQALVNGWNPNERAAASSKSPLERASSQLTKLTPEERQALLEKLRAIG
jgi:hypothetical protein